METTWLIVADEGQARALAWHPAERRLKEVKTLRDDRARADESTMHHGPHGRRGTAASAPGATVSAGDTQKHQEAELFARHVVSWLQQQRQLGHFDRLKVIAAPRMLGLLRSAADKALWASVDSTEDKDLIHERPEALVQRLFPAPPGA